MSEFKCPTCGSENIQKCEVIYMSGTVSHSSTTTMGRYEATTVFCFLACLFFKDSFIAFLVLGAIALLLGKSSMDADEYNKKVYPKEYERWKHSYICHRCGNRFIIR